MRGILAEVKTLNERMDSFAKEQGSSTERLVESLDKLSDAEKKGVAPTTTGADAAGMPDEIRQADNMKRLIDQKVNTIIKGFKDIMLNLPAEKRTAGTEIIAKLEKEPQNQSERNKLAEKLSAILSERQ